MDNKEIIPGRRFQFKEHLFDFMNGTFLIREVDHNKKVVYFDKENNSYHYSANDEEVYLSHTGFATINLL